MSKNSVCAFSTADDKYAVSSAVSLLSVRKKSPDIDLFLIGTKYSSSTKKFLLKHSITPIEIDLRDSFHTAWGYPIECYYIFAGPKILYEKGYDYSLYVDGDVYCNSDPFDFPIKTVKDFAGRFTLSTIEAILGDDTETATKLYGNTKTLQENRIQTGIVYFNNKSLAERDFLSKIAEVYQEAIDNGIPRKGDDSLFALFRLAYPKWSYLNLGDRYNKVTTDTRYIDKKEWLVRDASMITDCVFFHFTNHVKPWSVASKFPTYTHSYFYHAWRRHAVDTLSGSELKKYYPNIHSTLSDDHLKFYWYPTTNVGDLITPYFLEKVCRVNNLAKHSISEREIKYIERPTLRILRATKKVSIGYSRAKTKLRTAWRSVKPLIPPNPITSTTIRFAKSTRAHVMTFRFRVNRKVQKLKNRLLPSNIKPKDKIKRARYSVSTGSVIRLCGDYAMVYGSGIRDENQETRNSLVRLVRGPLTRNRFIEEGHACPPIYGDPGLLLPRFYAPKASHRKYKLGLIPHFTEYEDIVKLYRKNDDVLVIDMASGDLEKVIDQINSCRKTISSSLHGLVISHAYGIPTRQVEFSDRIHGDGTKFIDYYEGIGLKRLKPINAKELKYIPVSKLSSYSMETLDNYSDQTLLDAMFFDQNGFKPSARYPYA